MKDTRHGHAFVTAVAAVIVGGFALALTAGGAQAQDAPTAPGAPDASDRVLEFPGEWVKRCSEGEGGQFCEISYGSIVDVGERKVWLSRIGIFESGDQRDLFMFTPLGSALRRGVLYRIDEAQPQQAAYSVCIQLQGCQAITQIESSVIDEMKSGNQFQVQFTVANRPPLVGVVTLAGFTAAYEGDPEVTVGGEETPIEQPVSDEPPAEAVEGDAGGGKGDAPAQ